jgi:hypothetical protein
MLNILEAVSMVFFLVSLAVVGLSWLGVMNRVIPDSWKVVMISRKYGLSKEYVRQHLHEFGE